MREIKYRAYHKTLKIELDVLVIDWLNELVDLEGGLLEQEFKDVELLQYTGRKDKNGVEIFDGDIVSSIDFEHNREHKGIVVFDRGGFRVAVNLKGFKFNLPFSSFEGNESSLQVLGNIYQNPELLEREAEWK